MALEQLAKSHEQLAESQVLCRYAIAKFYPHHKTSQYLLGVPLFAAPRVKQMSKLP